MTGRLTYSGGSLKEPIICCCPDVIIGTGFLQESSASGHFTFTKDLHWYSYLLTKKNLKRIFAFMKKRQKSKVVLSLFQWTITGAVHIPGSKWSRQASSLELNSASQHQIDARAQTVSVNICDSAPFISCICEQDVSKVTALWFYTIPAYKKFQRNALLLDSGGEWTCYYLLKQLHFTQDSSNSDSANLSLNFFPSHPLIEPSPTLSWITASFWTCFQSTPFKIVSILFFQRWKPNLQYA